MQNCIVTNFYTERNFKGLTPHLNLINNIYIMSVSSQWKDKCLLKVIIILQDPLDVNDERRESWGWNLNVIDSSSIHTQAKNEVSGIQNLHSFSVHVATSAVIRWHVDFICSLIQSCTLTFIWSLTKSSLWRNLFPNKKFHVDKICSLIKSSMLTIFCVCACVFFVAKCLRP